MIVSKNDEGEMIYRAVICQCYYPNDPHNEMGYTYVAKVAESITAKNQLLQDIENESRRDFMNELKEKDIIISTEDEEMLVEDNWYLYCYMPNFQKQYNALLGHKRQGMTVLGGYKAQSEYLEMHPDTFGVSKLSIRNLLFWG